MLASRTRVIEAPTETIWAVVADPNHFPRWWPGVVRVEGVHGDRFTQVYTTKRGRTVRMDFRLISSAPPQGGDAASVSFEQEISGTPFERVLNRSVTEVALEPHEGATKVTIAQEQKLRGYSRTGGWMLRRVTASRLREALDGLERVTAGNS